jgi:uncharacterized protein
VAEAARPPAPPPGGTVPTGAPHWGLGDAAAGFLVAVLASTFVTAAVLAATGRSAEASDDLPLTLVAVLQVPLWIGLAGAPVLAAKRKGRGVVEDFGVRLRASDVPIGLVAGAVTQALLVPLLYVPIFRLLGDDLDVSGPARSLTDRATGVGVVLLVLVVAIGAPVVEELFFRGLLLRALERRLGPAPALWLSAVLFGLSHFQLLQLPALVLFGLVAGLLAQRRGRLGPAVCAHLAFNAWTVAVLLGAETVSKIGA